VTQGSYAELARRRAIIDPRDLSLPFDSRFTDRTSIPWVALEDLVGSGRVLAPLAAVTTDRLPSDPFHSEWAGSKLFDTNGLASAFTLAEALSHAIAEVIERHSVTVASVAIENPGVSWPHGYRLIDQATVPRSTRRLVERVSRGGYRLSILDATCALGVPTFHVHLAAPRESSQPQFASDRFIVEGAGAHPNPEVAINTAILEAVQSRVGMIAGAREDFALRARSLGRHERTRCHSRAGLLFRHGGMGMTKSFEEVRGFCSEDARDDVVWMVEQLRRLGVDRVLFADLSLPEIAPARVVRVLVPRVETLNPIRTGPWARKALIGDLLGVVPVAR
jgi:ribosomal protein S12 methylthiotransferase accessory factor